VVGTLLGYAVFAIGSLAIIALLTVFGAWWLRLAARRWFGWVPPSRDQRGDAKK
jgi:hypothetical protein